MRIRPALPADAESVSRLVLLAIGDIAYKLTGERTEDAALDKLGEYFRTPGNRFSAERHALLTADDGEIAGTILCYSGAEADKLYEPISNLLRDIGASASQDREADENEYYIDALAVFPAYQGRGYAKALIRHAESEAIRRGLRKIGLNVDVEKEEALALYTKLGFEEDKRIQINGHPFRHMRKTLQVPSGQGTDL